MKDEERLLGIVQTALGTFDHRRSYSPGMFEPLTPLFRKLGYASVAIYIADDYPDRMRRAAGYGGEDWFPDQVALSGRKSLYEELSKRVAAVPGIMTAKLFSHNRELGVLAATTPSADSREAREAFDVLARSLSIMAYIERIRTNGKREREERDLFFAQSLTNRLLIREVPKIRGLRLGFKFNRSLEARGDFFDFVPTRDGGLLGFIGSCNGTGLRTVLEVCNIMRKTHRACHVRNSLSDTIKCVNDHLVTEKRRAHQASLCLFEVDVKNRRLSLAKAGRLGLYFCGQGGRIDDMSSRGMFLGMVPKLKVKDEIMEFKPGQSLFCVTESSYAAPGGLNLKPRTQAVLQAIQEALAARRKVSLANAVLARLEAAADSPFADEPKLALSVEAIGKV